MDIQLHAYNKHWYKYIIPKRLTDVKPIYKWLFWVIELNKEEYQKHQYRKGQRTFIYCPHCDCEMISNNSFVKDTDFVYYKCKNCETESKWDFDCPAPYLFEYKEVGKDWERYKYE